MKQQTFNRLVEATLPPGFNLTPGLRRVIVNSTAKEILKAAGPGPAKTAAEDGRPWGRRDCSRKYAGYNASDIMRTVPEDASEPKRRKP